MQELLKALQALLKKHGIESTIRDGYKLHCPDVDEHGIDLHMNFATVCCLTEEAVLLHAPDNSLWLFPRN